MSSYIYRSGIDTTRSDIKRSRNIQGYSPEQIEKLTRMGLLERKYESTIDEKVARLEAFCINNSKLWYLSKSKEPYLEEDEINANDEALNMLSIDRLKKLEQYYDEIIRQNDAKIKRLKESS